MSCNGKESTDMDPKILKTILWTTRQSLHIFSERNRLWRKLFACGKIYIDPILVCFSLKIWFGSRANFIL